MTGQCTGQAGYLTYRITEPDGSTGAGAGRNGYARLPVGMTGTGPHVALLPAAGVGDICRFAGPKDPVSWAGPFPTVHQSGDQKHVGRIKKTGTPSPAGRAR